MNKRFYIDMREALSERPSADRAVYIASVSLTGSIYAAYTGGGLYLLLRRDSRLGGYLAVPAAVFLTGSVIRDVINAKRPYEVLDLKLYSAGEKKMRSRRGKSMPSRHTFSASVIASAFFRLNPAAGMVMTAAAAGVGTLRVLTGNHWVRDVAAGFLFGIAGGRIGYYLLDRI